MLVKIIATLCYGVFLLLLSLTFMFSPRSIQAMALGAVKRGWAGKWLEPRFRSNSYLFHVRVVGFGAFLMFALMMWGAVRFFMGYD
ncbi:MAG: hypothetical protein WCJ97_07760 [Phycisphaerae bacterium]